MKDPNKYTIKYITLKDYIINNIWYLLYISFIILFISINSNRLIFMNNFIINNEDDLSCKIKYSRLLEKLLFFSPINKYFLILFIILFLTNNFLKKYFNIVKDYIYDKYIVNNVEISVCKVRHKENFIKCSYIEHILFLLLLFTIVLKINEDDIIYMLFFGLPKISLTECTNLRYQDIDSYYSMYIGLGLVALSFYGPICLFIVLIIIIKLLIIIIRYFFKKLDEIPLYYEYVENV